VTTCFAVFRCEVCHLDVFDLIPALLDDVQLRRVGRQSFEVEPRWMFALIPGVKPFVTLQVVPDDNDFAPKMFNDRAMKMFVQFVEHIRHLGGLRAAGKCCRKEFHRVTDRRKRNESDGREMVPFFRLDDDVGYADGRPTSQEKRHQREAGFIDKYDVPDVVTRFFFDKATCTAANVRWRLVNIFSTA